MVNEDDCWLEENGNQGNRCRPGVNTPHPCIATEEGDNGRNVDKIFGDKHCSTHIYLQLWTFKATGYVERKPCGVDEGTSVWVRIRTYLFRGPQLGTTHILPNNLLWYAVKGG